MAHLQTIILTYGTALDCYCHTWDSFAQLFHTWDSFQQQSSNMVLLFLYMGQLWRAMFTHGTALDSYFHLKSIGQLFSHMGQFCTALFTHQTAVFGHGTASDSCFHIWDGLKQLSVYIRQLFACMGQHWAAILIYGTAADSGPHSYFHTWDSIGELFSYGTAWHSCAHTFNSFRQRFSLMEQPWASVFTYQMAVFTHGTAFKSCFCT